MSFAVHSSTTGALFPCKWSGIAPFQIGIPRYAANVDLSRRVAHQLALLLESFDISSKKAGRVVPYVELLSEQGNAVVAPITLPYEKPQKSNFSWICS